MMDDVSSWALEVAAEQLGFKTFSEVPPQRMGDVYDLAEDIDY